jgi:hypothetical protein
MKNKLLLSLALGMAGATSVMAAGTTVDVYITGSTAFRANVYNAATKLYSTAPTIFYADAAHGGANGAGNSSTASWVMTGSPISSLTTLSGDTLVIHGLFTGSIQGIQSVENQQQLIWALPTGPTPGQNAGAYTTNTATIAYSDASSLSSPFPVDGVAYLEENVCVQPFAYFKSQAGGAVSTITNVSWEQMEYGIPNGRIPLSAWSYNAADTNTFIYLAERTADSGTRRCFTAGNYYQFNDPVTTYIYDATNNFFYIPNTLTNFTFGVSNATVNAGVIGSEGPGLGNANVNSTWGFGYIGGGDIKNTLNIANSANQEISYLSMNDGKGVGSANWNNLISFNGVYPTRAGAGIHGNTGTNDYSPITLGYYPCWGFEVIVFPTSPANLGSGPTGQDISANQLGDNSGSHPGSFLAIFNAQVPSGTAGVTGSVDAEIQLSEPTGATGIRLNEMTVKRPQVGGQISPF